MFLKPYRSNLPIAFCALASLAFHGDLSAAEFYQNSAGVVSMEAESGDISSSQTSWAQSTGPSGASDGLSMSAAGASSAQNASAALGYSFSIDTAGIYHILFRVKTSGTQSMWVDLDGNLLNTAGNSTGAVYFNSVNSDWTWVHGWGATNSVYLSAGNHEIKLNARSTGWQLDKIAIVANNSDLITWDVHSTQWDVGPQGPDETRTSNPPPPSDGHYGEVSNFGRFPGDVQYSTKGLSIPNCDDASAVAINSVSEFGLIATSSARVFCVTPGDYRSIGQLDINGVSGTESQPKMLVLDTRSSDMRVDSVIFDESSSRALLPRLAFNNSDNWVLDRMAFVDTDGGAPFTNRLLVESPLSINNSENVVVSRSIFSDNWKGVEFRHGSHNSVVQNSLFTNQNLGVGADIPCVMLLQNEPSGGHLYDADIHNVHIINNEFKNCNDGVMTLWQPEKASNLDSSAWPDFQGLWVKGNDFYVTNSIKTDCFGNKNQSGICSLSENAIDIKAGSKSSSNPIVIEDNRMWGFRKADTNSGELSDPGSAVVVHLAPSNNVKVRRNIIWDSGTGVQVTRGASHISVTDNLVVNSFGSGPVDNQSGRPFGNNGVALIAGDGTENALPNELLWRNVSNVDITGNSVARSSTTYGTVISGAHVNTFGTSGSIQSCNIDPSNSNHSLFGDLVINTRKASGETQINLPGVLANQALNGCSPNHWR